MPGSKGPARAEQQNDLSQLLDYIANDPALRTPQEAQMIVTYSRMIRLVGLLRRGQRELAATMGLHAGDFDILFLLQRAGARQLRAKEISAVLRVTQGGISKRIDRLATAGLVFRKIAKGDRRANIILLTDEGVALANDARARSKVDSFNVLDEQEWGQMDALLKRMIEAHLHADQD